MYSQGIPPLRGLIKNINNIMKNNENGLTAKMVAEGMIKDTFQLSEKGTVLSTNNYDLFKFLQSNRNISESN